MQHQTNESKQLSTIYILQTINILEKNNLDWHYTKNWKKLNNDFQ
jgi:hypothetical protein